MPENRKFIRRPTNEKYEVIDRTNDEVVGQIINLSKKGVLIKTDRPYKAPSYLWCRMDLPEKIEGKEHILFDIEIKWCRHTKTKDEEYYETGCQLLNVSKRVGEVIDSLTRLFMARQSDAINQSPILAKRGK